MRTASLRSRLGLCAAAALLAAGLGACSGDDEGADGPGGDASSEEAGEKGDGDDGASPTDRPDPEAMGAQERPCQAQVEVTGAEEHVWDGQASVRFRNDDDESDGPAAVYTSGRGKRTVRAYSTGPGFDSASVNFVYGQKTYASAPGEAAGIDVAKSARGADIDAELTSVDGATVRVVATFDCGKPKKQ